MDRKRISQKQEKSVAKQFGGKTTPASGAKWAQKADVRTDRFLVECKTTSKDYYSLTAKVWEKIEEEAIRDHGRVPLMVIDLNNSDRVVVFKANDLISDKNVAMDVTKNFSADNVPKSHRISIKELEESAEYCGMYIWGKLFLICEKKRSMLIYMRVKDFKEVYIDAGGAIEYGSERYV